MTVKVDLTKKPRNPSTFYVVISFFGKTLKKSRF